MENQEYISIESDDGGFLHYDALQENNTYSVELDAIASECHGHTYSALDEEICVDNAPILAGMSVDLTIQTYAFCWDNIPGGMASPVQYHSTYSDDGLHDSGAHTINAASPDIYHTQQRFDPNMVNLMLVG